MSNPMKVQAQIRQNAEEVSSYLTDMIKWEKEVIKKDKKMMNNKSNQIKPVRGGVGTVAIKSTSINKKMIKKTIKVPKTKTIRENENNINNNIPIKVSSSSSSININTNTTFNDTISSAASHTYDKGYKKWESLDVDALLEQEEKLEKLEKKKKKDEEDDDADDDEYEYVEIEVEEDNNNNVNNNNNNNNEGNNNDNNNEISLTTTTSSSLTTNLTPASFVDMKAPTRIVTAPVAKARGNYKATDTEAAERDRGNTEFRNGNFIGAVKSYTRCLGLKSKNYVAFSNRAMAHLKLKEYSKAEDDANSALNIQSDHIKSLMRRAIARINLGKLRTAVGDLLKAQNIEILQGLPPSKQLLGELVKARELLKNAVSRAPMVSININKIKWEGSSSSSDDADGNDKLSVLPGPELLGSNSSNDKGSCDNDIVEMDEDGNFDLSACIVAPIVIEKDEKDVKESVRISIELDNDDVDNNNNNNNNDTLKTIKIVSDPAIVSARLKELELEDEAMIKKKTKASAVAATISKKSSDNSNGKNKKDNNSNKKKKDEVIGTYALERLLLGCKGSPYAYKKIFGNKDTTSDNVISSGVLKPKDLSILISKLLEANLVHSLIRGLDIYYNHSDSEYTLIEAFKGMMIWLTALTKDGNGWKNLKSIALMLGHTERAEITKIILNLREKSLSTSIDIDDIMKQKCTFVCDKIDSIFKD